MANKVTKISEKICDFLLGRMYFTDNDGYQNFLVFAPMLSSVISDSNKKLLTEYQPDYHMKNLNYMILILNQPCLI